MLETDFNRRMILPMNIACNKIGSCINPCVSSPSRYDAIICSFVAWSAQVKVVIEKIASKAWKDRIALIRGAIVWWSVSSTLLWTGCRFGLAQPIKSSFHFEQAGLLDLAQPTDSSPIIIVLRGRGTKRSRETCTDSKQWRHKPTQKNVTKHLKYLLSAEAQISGIAPLNAGHVLLGEM